MKNLIMKQHWKKREYEVETTTGQILLNKMYLVRVNKVDVNNFLVKTFELENALVETKIYS